MKEDTYRQALEAIEALVEGETDAIAVMSTVACELFHAFDHFIWVGFYRRVAPDTLKVGPYQGTHGCLTIDVARGVCGACVRGGATQLENDVSRIPHHIACSSETRSEIVLPVFDDAGDVVAVLDVDSSALGAFDDTDVRYLEPICGLVSARLTHGSRNEQ